ncbi:unnamed protein product [Vitrella brassicaformis CCMP3155]|uniref:RING-type domain-containing protein n=2 Tax=Vitrella brassicaformis TaxID=1169539 RepID=A0A0G4EVT2_VITBC|nr:unnamed protein product [Vitrella brassicaformis CCMP3155]|eukprot:CEM02537.1 unnamed protein product [Vitrella brassicaformis CCMP3155]
MPADCILDDQTPPPPKCAACFRPLEDALILSCDHNLCLICAANALKTSTNLTIHCSICGAPTAVDPQSAEQLLQGPSPPSRDPSFVVSPPSSTSGAPSFATPGKEPVVRKEGARHVALTPSPLPPLPTFSAKGTCGQRDRRDTVTQTDMVMCHPVSSHTLTAYRGEAVRPLGGANRLSHAIVPRKQPQDADKFSDIIPAISASPFSENSRRSSLSLKSLMPCRDHPDEVVQYFCLTCESACVCAECVIHGIHKGHEVQNIKRAYPLVKGKVEDYLYNVTTRVEELAIVEQRIEQHRRDLTASVHAAKHQMAKAFEDVKQRLVKKESELLKNAELFLEESMDELDSHLRTAKEKSRQLDECAAKIRSHVAAADEVGLLNYYADVKNYITTQLNSFDTAALVELPEAATRRVVSNVESTSAHLEALHSLNRNIANLRGLEPHQQHHQHQQQEHAPHQTKAHVSHPKFPSPASNSLPKRRTYTSETNLIQQESHVPDGR